jgi:hypothetical protein
MDTEWQLTNPDDPMRGWTHTAVMPHRAGNDPTAYDPVTGHAWRQAKSGYLLQWKPVENEWIVRSSSGETANQADCRTGEIDRANREYVTIGKCGSDSSGKVEYYDIDEDGLLTSHILSTSGPLTVERAPRPGLAYDTSINKLVGWMCGPRDDGGDHSRCANGDVYSLDFNTATWTRHPEAAGNTVRPTEGNKNGTFGRFRYSPQKNIYVMFNHARENVFLYRLDSSGAVEPDEPPPPPTELEAR